jgi:hypothetical protein
MKADKRNTEIMIEKPEIITLETTIIDIISQYSETEAIFKKLEEKTGACICCQALFLSLREAVDRFGFDVECVQEDINAAIYDRQK